MATRILLICHGATAATRSTAFPLDETLEPGQRDAAATLAGRLTFGTTTVGAANADQLDSDRLRNPSTRSDDTTPPGTHTSALTGTALRCRQTAQALGLNAVPDPGLADWDLGRWAGHTLDDQTTDTPQDVEAWLTDPDFAGHHGESLTSVITRVGEWLEHSAERPARLVAVTHAAWIRAAVVHALRAAPHSFWRVDVAPLSVVELRGGPGRWALYARR